MELSVNQINDTHLVAQWSVNPKILHCIGYYRVTIENTGDVFNVIENTTNILIDKICLDMTITVTVMSQDGSEGGVVTESILTRIMGEF